MTAVESPADAAASSFPTDLPPVDQEPGVARHRAVPESADEPRLKVELDAVIAQWVRRARRGRSTSRSAHRRAT